MIVVRQFVGKVAVPRSDMPNIKLRLGGWNATEVLVRSEEQWKYAHVHWAQIAAK